MRFILILVLMVFHSSQARAVSGNTAYAIALLTPGFITGALFLGDNTAEGRLGKYFLVERGYSATKGASYLAGYHFSPDVLLFGRLGEEGRPGNDLEAFKGEFGARKYWKALYGEIGLFQSNHRTYDIDYDSSGKYYYAHSNKYRTIGLFTSLGVSIQFWRLSVSFRGIFYKGISDKVQEKSKSPQALNDENEQKGKNLYDNNGNFCLDFGLSI